MNHCKKKSRIADVCEMTVTSLFQLLKGFSTVNQCCLRICFVCDLLCLLMGLLAEGDFHGIGIRILYDNAV